MTGRAKTASPFSALNWGDCYEKAQVIGLAGDGVTLDVSYDFVGWEPPDIGFIRTLIASCDTATDRSREQREELSQGRPLAAPVRRTLAYLHRPTPNANRKQEKGTRNVM